MNSMKNARRAFTLVELLVVIGIIGVLISLLMPGLTKARRASNTAVCESNMRQIGQAMMMYADAQDGFLFPDDMGADAQHITDFPTQPTDASAAAIPPYAPGSIDQYNHVVYYLTWPGMVLGGWTGTPPALPATPSATVDQSLLNFTKSATAPVMFCPADDPATYGYHSYFVNEHLVYWNLKYSTKLPNGQSPSSVVLLGEKITAVSNYYMKTGDYAAGKIELNRHPCGVGANPLFGTVSTNDPTMQGRMVALGSNYLFLDFHVENTTITPAPNALDPWDFANGMAPPSGSGLPPTE